MPTVALPEQARVLGPAERRGLIPLHIATRSELAAWEHANIARAVSWLEQRRRRGSVLTVRFLRALHRKMFDETWEHAGRLRRTRAGVGVPAWTVGTRVEDVIARARGWIQEEAYHPDEIAVRLHHRLTEVRPFERGNGRVTRLMADALVVELGQAPFTWGASSELASGELAEQYRVALRMADNDHISALLAFARS